MQSPFYFVTTFIPHNGLCILEMTNLHYVNNIPFKLNWIPKIESIYSCVFNDRIQFSFPVQLPGTSKLSKKSRWRTQWKKTFRDGKKNWTQNCTRKMLWQIFLRKLKQKLASEGFILPLVCTFQVKYANFWTGSSVHGLKSRQNSLKIISCFFPL